MMTRDDDGPGRGSAAVDRALELLADTVELPPLTLVRDGQPVPRAELRCSAELLQLLTRYRRALADLVTEAVGR